MYEKQQCTRKQNHLITSSFLFNDWSRSPYSFVASAFLLFWFPPSCFIQPHFSPVLFEEMVVSERGGHRTAQRGVIRHTVTDELSATQPLMSYPPHSH